MYVAKEDYPRLTQSVGRTRSTLGLRSFSEVSRGPLILTGFRFLGSENPVEAIARTDHRSTATGAYGASKRMSRLTLTLNRYPTGILMVG